MKTGKTRSAASKDYSSCLDLDYALRAHPGRFFCQSLDTGHNSHQACPLRHVLGHCTRPSSPGTTIDNTRSDDLEAPRNEDMFHGRFFAG